jgi:Uma2 family endonuclease
MAMPAARTDWTVDMLDALEDDGQKYEIIDGVLFVTPSPTDIHVLVAQELSFRLTGYVRLYRTGKVIASASDVRRGDRTRNRVQPDVFVLRVPATGRPPYPWEMTDLLLAVEVLSPSTRHVDLGVKRELYLSNGVPEYWAIDTERRQLTRWRSLDDSGDIISDRIEWTTPRADSPLVIHLAEFFDEAVRWS